MKKILKRLLVCLLLVPCLVLFSGCSKDGLSAYEIAVKNGFKGTEIEWLESLKGNKGDKGDKGEALLSAYEIAVQEGFEGTEEEWLESLKGDKGDKGDPGTNGNNGKDGEDALSSYKMWEDAFLNGDTTLSYTEWLAENFDIIFDAEKYAINKNLLSVVEVKSFANDSDLEKNINSKSAGSAVIYKVDTNGDVYLVTNYHVTYCYGYVKSVYPLYRLQFFNQSSGNYMKATFVGGSATYDIAILKIDATDVASIEFFKLVNAKPVTVATNDAVAGTSVFAIGNSNGNGINISKGVVDIESENVQITVANVTENHRLLRHDAYITNGNSGGGLFDENGDLVGITNGGKKSDDTVKYAIPVTLVEKIAEQLIESYKDDALNYNLKKCDLGLTLSIIATIPMFNETTELVEIVDIIEISKISNTSPFAGKLEEGDYLISATLAGQKIELTREYNLDELMLQARENDSLILEVERSGETESVFVEIALDGELFKKVV